ncbi:hypothetical protein [Curtobacterium sp. MCBD17_040]|uniref:hypothetical protein n=1 Tax=Curtobacterium sp. MCBD17_040 TaxID=2175674 RepID=UPI000DA9EF77|nr:hypothetical protein [Curtobacterium sp. MCBD17_040]WIB65341.1 hypothetical protein DEI94_18210 [Curtobacterium sp. MCBD17_040]
MRTFTIRLSRNGRQAGTVTFDETGGSIVSDLDDISCDGTITGVRGFGYDTDTTDISLRHFLRNPQQAVGMHPHITDTHFGDSALLATVGSVDEQE